MSVQSGQFALPASVPTQMPRGGDACLPAGAYRANLYVYDPFGRIDWYALVPKSFEGGRFFSLGRGPDCDIILTDGAVSTRHAYIAAEEQQLVLRDLRSTNGTRVDGERVQEHALQHGDVIRIGASDLRFLYSYRNSPVNLVLTFLAGPNAGRVLATTSASTSIGRLNCQVNLQGPEIAPQHVRIDAFGEDLLFVVNLQRTRLIWVNDEPVTGICPARKGDRLRVGEHEMQLQVVEPQTLTNATPRPDGTLLIREPDALPQRRHEPVMQLDPVGGDSTDEDAAPTLTEQADALFLSPTSPADAIPPPTIGTTAEIDTEDDPYGPPEARWHARNTVARPPATARRTLILGVLLGAIIGGAALWELPRSLSLGGTLRASAESSLVATARGRIEKLYFRVGDVVQPGDVVAHLVDLDTQAEIDRLSAEVARLETDANTPKMVAAPPVPPALLNELRVAEARLDTARDARRAHLQAFNRREVSLEQLEAARTRAESAQRVVTTLRARVGAVRRNPQLDDRGPSEARLARIAQLVRRREKLQRRLRVSITADHAGLLASVDAQPTARTGAEVRAGEPLFLVLSINPLEAELTVPGAVLGEVQQAGTAQVTVSGGEAYTLRLGPSTPAGEGQHIVRGVIDNPTGQLRPGHPVSAVIEQAPTTALAVAWQTLFP